MKKAAVFLILFFTFFMFFLRSQDIEVNASINSEEVGLNDFVIYTVSFKGITSPEELDLSKFKDFRVVQQYKGSSFSMINGKSSYFINYNYYLKPLKNGVLNIPSISYEYGGKTYKTKVFQVKVGEGQSSQPGKQSNRRSNPRSLFDDDFFKKDPFAGNFRQKEDVDVRLEAYITKNNVFTNEQIIFKVLLITRNNVSSVNLLSNPSFKGFWHEDFQNPSVISGKQRTIDGKNYHVYEVKKVALYPSKSGTIKIPPLKFELELNLRGRSIFSEKVRKVRSTREVQINVQPLPQNFENLSVGKFELDVEIPQKQIDINDIFTINVTVQGDGNLKTARLPELKNDQNYKVYPAKITNENKFAGDMVIGKVNLEFPITFLKNGIINLQDIEFKYFDPQLKTIRTLKKGGYQINVTGKKEDVAKFKSENTDVEKSYIKREGVDIDFIITGNVHNQDNYLHNKKIFILLLVFPFLVNIFILSKVFLINRFLLNNKIFKKNKVLNSTLSELNEIKTYKDISPVLEKFLNRKLELGHSSMSNVEIDRCLLENGIKDFDISHFMRIKSKSDSVRFSPTVENKENLKKDLELIKSILKRIDKEIK